MTERDEMVRTYIKTNFRSDDRLAVVLIQKRSGAVVQRIAPAERIVEPDALAWLHKMNNLRFEVYGSLNTLRPDARTREKAGIAEMRHVYAEFDQEAATRVLGMQSRKDMPQPNHLIESSPGKRQVIWRVEGFEKNQAEEMMRGLVREFGADPACTDCSRVLRIPGFHNHKYEQPHLVTVQNLSDQVYRPAAFPRFDRETPRAYTELRNGTKRADGAPISQSERDWAFAKRHLARGEEPDAVTRAIAEYRAKDGKHRDPYEYAKRTVGNALRAINHSRSGPSR